MFCTKGENFVGGGGGGGGGVLYKRTEAVLMIRQYYGTEEGI